MVAAVEETPNAVSNVSYNWISKSRNYDEEAKQSRLPSMQSTDKHPLRQFEETQSVKKSENDNKSSASLDVEMDPLSRMFAEVSTKDKENIKQEIALKSSFEPWSFKKNAILARYTTVEKLTLKTSFLAPLQDKDKVIVKSSTSTTVTDKIKDRLEQLDQFEEDANMQEMINLSQQEYAKRIEELNNELLQAWAADERVKALKIVIQCAKLLADTSVIQFYPSKFVLITDILDTFGKLVYDRIRSKSTYIAHGSAKPQPLPEKFTADIVPASAKETCRNWFFKIASIRELLPRIYVEVSILKCLNYLSDNGASNQLNRLILMANGIGNPLVSAYASCYICRVGVSIDPKIKHYQSLSFENILYVFNQLTNIRILTLLKDQKIDSKNYLELFCPAVDWILQCSSNNQTNKYLNEIVENCISLSNSIVSGLLINSMMSAFEPSYISSMANKFVDMIKQCDEDYFPKHLLFRNLGMCLVLNEADKLNNDLNKANVKKEDLLFLNEVWKIVAKFSEPEHYISCAEIWIEYTLKNFTKNEVNTLIGDIIKHLQPDRTFEKFYSQLQSIASKILGNITNFSVLFSMDKFLQFLDLFQKESIRVEVCKSVAYSFLRNNPVLNSINDIVIINSMVQICKSMHDYVNALTIEDEKREIANLICSFINRVELDDKEKFEQNLNFCSDARASFSNLDNVIALLVHKVNNLSMQTLKIVNYNHTKRTGAFVRACIAYSFITIPSLSNPIIKLGLYLESAHVAILNQCLSQGDAFLKASISLIADISKLIESNNLTYFEHNNTISYTKPNIATIERLLYDYICNLFATLLLTPDNPEQGGLYLLNGILNVIQNHLKFEQIELKFQIYLNFICLLSAMKQEKYIHHVENVELNDTLYGSDAKFLKELNKINASVLENAFEVLQSVNTAKQLQLALDLFSALLAHGDLKNDECLALAKHIWNLSKRQYGFGRAHEQLIANIKQRAQKSNEYKILFQTLKSN